MPYKIDFFDGEVVEWSLTDGGATSQRVLDYTPTFYVGVGDGDDESLADTRSSLEQFPTVARTSFEKWRPGFRHDAERTLRVDCTDVEEVTRLARWVRERGGSGEHRCFNVDFSREFRYCLDEDRSPTPAREPTVLSIEGQRRECDDRELPPLTIGGEQIGQSPAVALPRIEEIVDREDPDVLIVDSAQLLAELHDFANELGYDLHLGRRPGFQRLASASTYTSYGRVGHSPARYNVPGRVLLDLSNTFFYRETNIAGCVDLV
jgi:DNA polymerase I